MDGRSYSDDEEDTRSEYQILYDSGIKAASHYYDFQSLLTHYLYQQELQINSRSAALEYFITKIRSSCPSDKNDERKIMEERLVFLALKYYKNIFVYGAADNHFTQTFNCICAISLPDANQDLMTNLEKLIHLFGRNDEHRNEIYQFVVSNLQTILLSSHDFDSNLARLITLFPEHVGEMNQATTHVVENSWNSLMQGVCRGVNNRDLQQYPWALLNKDRSVSIYVNPDETEQSHKEYSSNLYAVTNMRDIIMKAMKRSGFKLLEGKESPLDVIQHGDITEIRINIPLEHLDDLFKAHAGLYAYRGENNVLKLSKSFSLKEGFIRLCPVLPADDQHIMLRCDGCQISEMPGVQLLHMLPSYDGKEKHFHWMPEEVSKQLSPDPNSYLKRILRDFNMYQWCHLIYMNNSKQDPSLAEEGMLYLSNDGSYVSRYRDMVYEGNLLTGEGGNPDLDMHSIIRYPSELNRARVLGITSKRGHTHHEHKLPLIADRQETITAMPKSGQSDVRVVDMDDHDRHFYALYGNTGADELTHCRSLEVSKLLYFQYIRDRLTARSRSTEVIDAMIKNELTTRLQKIVDEHKQPKKHMRSFFQEEQNQLRRAAKCMLKALQDPTPVNIARLKGFAAQFNDAQSEISKLYQSLNMILSSDQNKHSLSK